MNASCALQALGLAAGLVAAVNVGAAELSAVQHFESVIAYFDDDVLRFSVRVGARDQAEKAYVSQDWPAHLVWHATDASGESVPLTIRSVRLLETESVPTLSSDGSPLEERWWMSHAMVAFEPLRAGTYTFAATYLTTSSLAQTVHVYRGDESPEVAATKLHRDVLRPGVSLAEYRRMQLKRFELAPLDESSLWDLAMAWANAPNATQAEVDEYFTRAIVAGRTRISVTFAQQPEQFFEDWPAFVEMRLQVASAYHDLMPELIASRGKLWIFWDAMEGEVRLSDRESGKRIRSICVPPCCRYPMDPF